MCNRGMMEPYDWGTSPRSLRSRRPPPVSAPYGSERRRSRTRNSSVSSSIAAAAVLLALLLLQNLGAAQATYDSLHARPGDAGNIDKASNNNLRRVSARSGPRRSLAQDAATTDPDPRAAELARRAGDVDLDELYAAAPGEFSNGPSDQPEPRPPRAADRLEQCRASYAAFLPVMHEELMLWAVHGINQSLMDAAFSQHTHLNHKAGMPIVFRCAAQSAGCRTAPVDCHH
jgi:hypothetical protein